MERAGTSQAVDLLQSGEGRSSRLAVAWQHPVTRRLRAVGLLSRGADDFTFSYLAAAGQVDGFQPFIGFPEMGREYRSARLFPLFAQRVMRAGRPDYARHLEVLALGRASDPWQVLARSQGQRQGDGIRLFAEPEVNADGATRATFFVSGFRHRLRWHPEVEQALTRLRPGDPLTLLPEPTNPVDSEALLVLESTDTPLGWIPSVLLPYVASVREASDPQIVVRAVQDAGAPPAFRLLVHLTGRLLHGVRPFSERGWELASEPLRRPGDLLAG